MMADRDDSGAFLVCYICRVFVTAVGQSKRENCRSQKYRELEFIAENLLMNSSFLCVINNTQHNRNHNIIIFEILNDIFIPKNIFYFYIFHRLYLLVSLSFVFMLLSWFLWFLWQIKGHWFRIEKIIHIYPHITMII